MHYTIPKPIYMHYEYLKWNGRVPYDNDITQYEIFRLSQTQVSQYVNKLCIKIGCCKRSTFASSKFHSQ